MSFIAGAAGAWLLLPGRGTAHADTPRTAVIADESLNALRFMIDGKEIARVDSSGLHVREDISYGGNLIDYGRSGFDSLTAEDSDGR